MRPLIRRMVAALLLLASTAPVLAGQAAPLTADDSALVGQVLRAEDRRDSLDPALQAARAHADARVRTLGERAYARRLHGDEHLTGAGDGNLGVLDGDGAELRTDHCTHPPTMPETPGGTFRTSRPLTVQGRPDLRWRT